MELRVETGEQRAGTVTVSVAGRLNSDNLRIYPRRLMNYTDIKFCI